MAENKKSFLLYCDLIHVVKKLPKETAGELFMHILSYVNDENPTTDNMVIDLVFEPIKQQLKRDLIKYETIRTKKSEAGKKSAEVKKQKLTKSTRVKSVEHTSTKSTVNDTVNVTDTVNDINKNIINNTAFANDCLKAEMWRQTIQMQYKISDEDVILKVQEFERHLFATDDQKKSTSDFKRHFTNWMGKQPVIQHPASLSNGTNQLQPKYDD